MTKKIVLFLLCILLLFSCGRKADPQFKDKNENIIKFKGPSEY